MSGEMICVFRARSVEEADIVAAWLDARGVTAEVKDRNVLGLEYGPLATYQRGVQICVLGEEMAEHAKGLLADREEADREEDASASPIVARCEECGHATEFPGSARGTVQDCPRCSRYMDVPE